MNATVDKGSSANQDALDHKSQDAKETLSEISRKMKKTGAKMINLLLRVTMEQIANGYKYPDNFKQAEYVGPEPTDKYVLQLGENLVCMECDEFIELINHFLDKTKMVNAIYQIAPIARYEMIGFFYKEPGRPRSKILGK